MSHAPKIDEIIVFVADEKPSLMSLTETCLKDTVDANILNVPGYNLISENCTLGIHGGV